MFQGSIVALVTPMQASGKLDETALENLITFHLEQGTDAILVIGTTGESPTLGKQERDTIMRTAVNCVAGRVPVIAGTGTNCTETSIEFSKQAKAAGVDACLLVTPYYNKPSQQGLRLHFTAIAAAVDLPHILYNVPNRTGCDLLADTVAELAEIENIVAIKEATADIERCREILESSADKISVLSGDDATALQLMQTGAKGVISVTANVAPALMHAMCEAALNGELTTAQRINSALDPLHRHLFVQSNPSPIKWAVAQLGLINHGIRLPLTPLQSEHENIVREAMQHAGVIQ